MRIHGRFLNDSHTRECNAIARWIWSQSLCPPPIGSSAVSTRICCIFCTREFVGRRGCSRTSHTTTHSSGSEGHPKGVAGTVGAVLHKLRFYWTRSSNQHVPPFPCDQRHPLPYRFPYGCDERACVQKTAFTWVDFTQATGMPCHIRVCSGWSAVELRAQVVPPCLAGILGTVAMARHTNRRPIICREG